MCRFNGAQVDLEDELGGNQSRTDASRGVLRELALSGRTEMAPEGQWSLNSAGYDTENDNVNRYETNGYNPNLAS